MRHEALAARSEPCRTPLLSPPISPFTKGSNTIDPVPAMSITVKDPILYPTNDAASSPPAPLFSEPVVEVTEARRVVDEHIALETGGPVSECHPQRREDYELALYFKSNVMRIFQENPRGWLRKEREILRADSGPSSLAVVRLLPSSPPILPAARLTQRQPREHQPQPVRSNVVRVKKPDQPSKPRRISRVANVSGEHASAGAPAKSSRAIHATRPVPKHHSC